MIWKYRSVFLLFFLQSLFLYSAKVTFTDNEKAQDFALVDNIKRIEKNDFGYILEEGASRTAFKSQKLPNACYPFSYALFKMDGTSSRKKITFRFKMRIYPVQNKKAQRELLDKLDFPGICGFVSISETCTSGVTGTISDSINKGTSRKTGKKNTITIDTTDKNVQSDAERKTALLIKQNDWSYCNSSSNYFSILSEKKDEHIGRLHESFIDLYGTQDVRMTFDNNNEILSYEMNGVKYTAKNNLKKAGIYTGPIKYYGFTLRKGSSVTIEVSEVQIYSDEAGEKVETKPVSEYPLFNVEHYTAGVKKGDADAMYQLATLYMGAYGGTERDYFKAVELLKKAAEKGHIFAMSELGTCYYKGIGVEEDRMEAEKWFLKAAEWLYGDALFRLGYCYLSDTVDGEKDALGKAFKYLGASAGQLNSNARVLLGEYYLNYDPKGTTARLFTANTKEHGDIYWEYNPQSKVNAPYDIFFTNAGMRRKAFRTDKLKSKSFDALLVNADPLRDAVIEKYTSLAHACYDENPKGQYGMALCLLNGSTFFQKADPVKGVEYLKKSADKGFIPALNKLGECYRDGVGTVKNPSEAEKLFISAASLNFAEASLNLAKLYLNGNTAPNRKKIGKKYLYHAIEQGSQEAKLLTGLLGELPDAGAEAWLGRDFKKAGDIWQKKAVENDATAKYYLGLMFIYGLQTVKNAEAGLKYLKEADENGCDTATAELGLYNENCKKYKIAATYFKKASEKNDPVSQLHIGKLYFENKLKSENNLKDAMNYLTKAAVQGSAEALSLLGECYYSLQERNEAPKNAFECFLKAAERGHKKASYRLGECYYTGRGIAVDHKKATEWWNKFEVLENRDNMSNMIYMPFKAKYAFNGIMD